MDAKYSSRFVRWQGHLCHLLAVHQGLPVFYFGDISDNQEHNDYERIEYQVPGMVEKPDEYGQSRAAY